MKSVRLLIYVILFCLLLSSIVCTRAPAPKPTVIQKETEVKQPLPEDNKKVVPEKPAPQTPRKTTAIRQNILKTIEARENCTKTLKALQLADMTQLLESPGPLTLLAPTDRAWLSMPKADYNALFGNKARMTEFIRYYIIDGKLTMTEMAGPVEMSMTDKVKATSLAGPISVNLSDIESKNIVCVNGVIHSLNGFVNREGR